jgi:BlaI family transcriptional regulator, penicillinase repressor
LIDDARRYDKLADNDTCRHRVQGVRTSSFPGFEIDMTAPEGKLTAAQFEIMTLTWSSANGLTIGEIWDATRSSRNVSRTTVLNLVDRLEKRGWLKRHKDRGIYRYVPAVERPAAEQRLAVDFVEEFFEGSASNLIMSLLGSKRISKADVERLKQQLQKANTEAARRKGAHND